MTLPGPALDLERLLLGVGPQLDANRAGGVNYILERPARDGLPEVIRIVHNNEEDLPIYISSDEEEAGEYEVGMIRIVEVVSEALGFPPLSSDEEDEPEEDGHQEEEWEEHDEDSEDSEDSEDDLDWFDFDREDSGYGSISEDEEASEDEDHVGDGNRPGSPLVQEFPPEELWHGWRRILLPIPDSPPIAAPAADAQQLTIRHPLETQEVSQRLEECAPSTSGPSSSAKRSREDSDEEEVSTKRPRWNFEECPEEPVPSTSQGLGSSINRGVWHCPSENKTWDDDSDPD